MKTAVRLLPGLFLLTSLFQVIQYIKTSPLSLKHYLSLLLFTLLIISASFAGAQPITGFWKGKIDRKNVELKIIKSGDSITGTSYYYESSNSYRRYSIKGFFDERDNNVVWMIN